MRRRTRRFIHLAWRHVRRLGPRRHEHDVVGGDRDRGRATTQLDIQPVGGQPARRLGEADVLHDGALHEIHLLLLEPGDQRLDEGLVLVELRTENMRHRREVGKQIDEAVQVTPKLDDAVLRQRTHQGRPEQPKLRLEELSREYVSDELTLQRRFGRKRKLGKGEAVAKGQPVSRPVYRTEVAVDNVRLVVERMLLIEREELLCDIDVWVAKGGDRPEQIQRAAELLVEDGAGQVVAMLRVAIQKEPAAELVLRLIDRDVRAGHVRVADEQRRRRQSGKPAANNMRLHPPLQSAPVDAPSSSASAFSPKFSTMRLAQREK